MTDAVIADRIQFAFTLMFHYLFPILTMGLAPLIVVLKTLHLLRREEKYAAAARFWTRIFALNFAVGVITGIPMEFQFGTNWARFSAFAGGVIGQTLALEGIFAFFLESSFLGVLLFAEERVRPWVHWLSAVLVAAGALLSGLFITATNAWMQHPVGFRVAPDGTVQMANFWALLGNPFLWWQYLHVINGAILTAAIVMASVGAYYLLSERHAEFGRLSVALGVTVGAFFALTQLFPTGDMDGRSVTAHQPLKLATMEGLFETQYGAPLAIIGMPDTTQRTLLDPVVVPEALSFLAYGSFRAEVKGLNDYPQDLWPPVQLTYYAYHIMVGLGTIFIAVLLLGAFLWWRRVLFTTRWFLWVLVLLLPFPYIANEAGWVTTEVGRQPWLVYELLRTSAGASPTVVAGETIFTLLGFAGMYALIGLLSLLLALRLVLEGPEEPVSATGR
ncbi:MAG TPA: cytochrome ubiquinol oxidase subunit I [Candidatus Acidoferrales bacterium]|nr:cytochrome ubiquinol oxidase subunit I [Candidatus Acidoferrales bacterium]